MTSVLSDTAAPTTVPTPALLEIEDMDGHRLRGSAQRLGGLAEAEPVQEPRQLVAPGKRGRLQAQEDPAPHRLVGLGDAPEGAAENAG